MPKRFKDWTDDEIRKSVPQEAVGALLDLISIQLHNAAFHVLNSVEYLDEVTNGMWSKSVELRACFKSHPKTDKWLSCIWLLKPPAVKPKPTKRWNHTEDDMAIAAMIAGRIQAMQPKRKAPDLRVWANEVRVMREIDERTPEDIKRVFMLAHRDEFWRKQILSIRNLRKHYDNLDLKLGGISAGPARIVDGGAKQSKQVFGNDSAETACGTDHIAPPNKRANVFWNPSALEDVPV